MMNPKFLFCLALVLSGGITGCTTTKRVVAKECVREKVAFKVSVPEKNASDHPISVRLQIENNRSEDIKLDWWERSTSLLLKATDGRDVPRTTKGANVFLTLGSRTNAVLEASEPRPHGTLLAGGSWKDTVNLEEYFHLKPGQYSLTASILVWVGVPLHTRVLTLQIEPLPFEVNVQQNVSRP